MLRISSKLALLERMLGEALEIVKETRLELLRSVNESSKKRTRRQIFKSADETSKSADGASSGESIRPKRRRLSSSRTTWLTFRQRNYHPIVSNPCILNYLAPYSQVSDIIESRLREAKEKPNQHILTALRSK